MQELKILRKSVFEYPVESVNLPDIFYEIQKNSEKDGMLDEFV
jgi:hypothetical protein